MAPTSSSSFSMGTATVERAPPSVLPLPGLSSAASSAVRQTFLDCSMRSSRLPGIGWNPPGCVWNSTSAEAVPTPATRWNALSWKRSNVPNLASQMRTAFSSMAWNTGSNSPGELEMTLSTSEVAVCCSSASVSSLVRACTSSNSRTFSTAITAWSANALMSATCLSSNGSWRAVAIAPTTVSPVSWEQRSPH